LQSFRHDDTSLLRRGCPRLKYYVGQDGELEIVAAADVELATVRLVWLCS
jgi:hypothetical protein